MGHQYFTETPAGMGFWRNRGKRKIAKTGISSGSNLLSQNGTFLTDKVNDVFEPIPRLNCIPESDKNKQGSISAALSNFVGETGFEPAIRNKS